MVEPSAAVAAAPAIPNLIFGLLAFLGGAAIVAFRENLYRFTSRGQNRIVGKRAGAALARLQSPFWIGAAGVFAALMGTVMISYAISRFVSS